MMHFMPNVGLLNYECYEKNNSQFANNTFLIFPLCEFKDLEKYCSRVYIIRADESYSYGTILNIVKTYF